MKAHKSIVRTEADLLGYKCENLGKCACYNSSTRHCDLCDPSRLGALTAKKLHAHFSAIHWNHKVQYKDVYILACNLNCGVGSHFHCPLCLSVHSRLSRIRQHLESCMSTAGNSQAGSSIQQNESNIFETLSENEQPNSVTVTVNVVTDSENEQLQNSATDEDVIYLSIEGGDGSEEQLQSLLSSNSGQIADLLNRAESEGSSIVFQLADIDSNKVLIPDTPSNAIQQMSGLYHKSFVRTIKDLDIEARERNKYCCPLCEPSLYQPGSLAKLNIHLNNSHWRRRIPTPDFAILACRLSCQGLDKEPSFHYHCPTCGSTDDYSAMRSHLATHVELQPEPAPPKAFQWVKAALSEELISLIPGSHGIFLDQLREKTSVDYSMEGSCYTLSGDWRVMADAHCILDTICKQPPKGDSDLSVLLNKTTSQPNKEPSHALKRKRGRPRKHPVEETKKVPAPQQSEDESLNVVGEVLADILNNVVQMCSEQDEKAATETSETGTEACNVEPGEDGAPYVEPSKDKVPSVEPKGASNEEDVIQTRRSGRKALKRRKLEETESQPDVIEETASQEKETQPKRCRYADDLIATEVTDQEIAGIEIITTTDGIDEVTDTADEDATAADEVADNDDEEPPESNKGSQKVALICPSCKKVFNKKPKFYHHLFGTRCHKDESSMPQYLRQLMNEVRQMITSTKCPICGKVFSDQENTQVHYALRTCEKSLAWKMGYQRDPTTQEYLCNSCNFRSANTRSVMIHESNKHIADDQKEYQCPICSRRYAFQLLLVRHLKTTHFAPKLHTTQCNYCGKTMYTKHIKQHIRMTHDPTYVKPKETALDYYIYCSMCEYQTLYPKNLALHVKRQHEDKNRQCPKCKRLLPTAEALAQHAETCNIHLAVAAKHTECPHCQKLILRKNLKSHIELVHENRRRYECGQCGNKFHTKYVLDCHLETHLAPSQRLPPKFLCPTCGRGFTNKTMLNDHINGHTGKRPYSCKHCSKTFKSGPALHRHLELHAGERYSCEVCNNVFISKSYWKQHMKRHELDRVHKCDCGADFQTASKLASHQQSCQDVASSQLPVVQAESDATYIWSEDGQQLVQVTEQDLENVEGETFVVLETVEGIDDVITVIPDDQVVMEAEFAVEEISQQVAVDSVDQANSNQEQFLCGHCEQIFISLEEVQDHMITHLGDITETEDINPEKKLL